MKALTNYRLTRVITSLAAAICVAGGASAAEYEWTFSQGNLNSSLGNGLLEYADSASQSSTTFGTSDGTTVPHIGGEAATFMRVPAFTALANGYNVTLSSTGPNGGGSYVNQYTVVYDLLSPGSVNWTPFFNTEPGNANDADFYIAPDGAIGIGALGYSAPGAVAADQWYRIAFSADLAAGTVAYYVNGTQVHQFTDPSLLDGRFALYSNVDPGADLRLFNEGDASGQYTHELLVSSIYATDRAMSSSEIAALAGPSAGGIVVPEPGTWALLGLGGLLAAAALRRRG